MSFYSKLLHKKFLESKTGRISRSRLHARLHTCIAQDQAEVNGLWTNRSKLFWNKNIFQKIFFSDFSPSKIFSQKSSIPNILCDNFLETEHFWQNCAETFLITHSIKKSYSISNYADKHYIFSNRLNRNVLAIKNWICR